MLVSLIYVKSIVSCLGMMLVLNVGARAQGWRGITPLHSTRTDVERLLGPPTSTTVSESYLYELERERVSFQFAKGPCVVEPTGWDVPRDTVISISITPKPKTLKFADLQLDEGKFKKERDREVRDVIRYISEERGVTYEVDTSYDNEVTLITYYPTAKDSSLRCHYAEELKDTTKFGSYYDVPFRYEAKQLDIFAGLIKQYTTSQVYIMSYAKRCDRTGEARVRADRARKYLIKKHHIDVRRIVVIEGGHREKSTIELYLVPPGASPPPSSPTVNCKGR